MTNELIEAMARALRNADCPLGDLYDDEPEMQEQYRVGIRAALAAAEAAGYRLVPGWVPVSERLPEKEQYPVLVAHQSGAVRMVFGIEPFIEGDWMGYYEPALQGRFLRGITHWMPLPEPPAEPAQREDSR